MATAAHTFDSKSSAGMPLRTVYLANGGVALALAACGSDMPRIVHWGREMGDPAFMMRSTPKGSQAILI